MLLRWDERFIVPASTMGESGMAQMKRVLQEVKAHEVCLSAPGDTLLINNWRMLHGRSSVPEECTDRILERAYLGAEN
jgi:hypothetical protein